MKVLHMVPAAYPYRSATQGRHERMSSVFTIWADVLLGWLASGGLDNLQRSAPTTWPERHWSITPGDWHVLINLVPLFCLLAAATCFHVAGLFWASPPNNEHGGNTTDRHVPSGGAMRGMLWAGLGFAFILACMTWDVFRPVAITLAL